MSKTSRASDLKEALQKISIMRLPVYLESIDPLSPGEDADIIQEEDDDKAIEKKIEKALEISNIGVIEISEA